MRLFSVWWSVLAPFLGILLNEKCCWTSNEMRHTRQTFLMQRPRRKQKQSKSKWAHNMNLLQQHRKQYVWDNFNEIVAGATVAAAAVLVARRCDENKINIQSICEYSSLNPPHKLSQSGFGKMAFHLRLFLHFIIIIVEIISCACTSLVPLSVNIFGFYIILFNLETIYKNGKWHGTLYRNYTVKNWFQGAK